MAVSCPVLLKIRNISENQTTQFTPSNIFHENRALYGIMCKDIVDPDMPRVTIYYGACALHAG